MSDSAARLAARYGAARPPARRLRLLLPVLLVAVVGLAYLFGVALRHSNPAARYGLLGFEVDGERGVSVRWQVDRAPDRVLRCELQALDAHHVTVGRREVLVPAGAPRRQDRTAYVTTTGPAVSASVVACR